MAKPEKGREWWAANGSRFQKGTRYFMGAPVTREHCIDVLKNGYQRQRILAAHYLSARTRYPAVQHQRAGMASAAPARQDVVTRRGCKYILAALAVAFLVASLMRASGGGGVSHPQTEKRGCSIGVIFTAVRRLALLARLTHGTR